MKHTITLFSRVSDILDNIFYWYYSQLKETKNLRRINRAVYHKNGTLHESMFFC